MNIDTNTVASATATIKMPLSAKLIALPMNIGKSETGENLKYSRGNGEVETIGIMVRVPKGFSGAIKSNLGIIEGNKEVWYRTLSELCERYIFDNESKLTLDTSALTEEIDAKLAVKQGILDGFLGIPEATRNASPAILALIADTTAEIAELQKERETILANGQEGNREKEIKRIIASLEKQFGKGFSADQFRAMAIAKIETKEGKEKQEETKTEETKTEETKTEETKTEETKTEETKTEEKTEDKFEDEV